MSSSEPTNAATVDRCNVCEDRATYCAACGWLFEVMGCEPQDELHDLFPGTGAVTAAWEAWRSQLTLPLCEITYHGAKP